MTLNATQAASPARTTTPDRPSQWRYALILLAILFTTILLRLPTFFEPPWHSDEGIFAAVAERLVHGGRLYADAWESKPPLFLFLYAGLFKAFGVSVITLRLASTVSALLTEVALYAVAVQLMRPKQALVAAAAGGFLLSVPFWEGTLALTEIFAVLPTTLAVAAGLRAESQAGSRRQLLLASGLLFGVAFLLRQTTAGVGAIFVLWLVLSRRHWLEAALLIGAGFGVVLSLACTGFALFGSFGWFWDANVGFFFHYVPSGKELPAGARPVTILPLIAAVAGLALSRLHREAAPAWILPALWLSATLAGAMLTGRAYSHYMLQLFPPLGLLCGLALPGIGRLLRATGGSQGAAIPSVRDALPFRSRTASSLSFQRASLPLAAFVLALAVTWGYVVVPTFSGNVFAMRYTRGPTYYANFAGWATGTRSQVDYDNYFDHRVALTRELARILDGLGGAGKSAYIWGEYPWVYPLADVQPADRYVTSFYVLLIPYLDLTLGGSLDREQPQFIVILDDARPKFHGSSLVTDRRYSNAMKALNERIVRGYQQVAGTPKATVYERGLPHPSQPSASKVAPELPAPGTLIESESSR